MLQAWEQRNHYKFPPGAPKRKVNGCKFQKLCAELRQLINYGKRSFRQLMAPPAPIGLVGKNSQDLAFKPTESGWHPIWKATLAKKGASKVSSIKGTNNSSGIATQKLWLWTYSFGRIFSRKVALTLGQLLFGCDDRAMAEVQRCVNVAKRVDNVCFKDAPHLLLPPPIWEFIGNPVSLTHRLLGHASTTWHRGSFHRPPCLTWAFFQSAVPVNVVSH